MSHRFAKAIRKFIVLAFIANMGLSALSEDPKLTLEAGFQQPPSSAKPRVWWHWMNGNITKEGIKLDLEWMNRIGIGGFQNFDASLGTPQLVEKRQMCIRDRYPPGLSLAVLQRATEAVPYPNPRYRCDKRPAQRACTQPACVDRELNHCAPFVDIQ